MKEFLTKNNHGNYELVYQKWRNDDIEIPDGANYAYNNDLGLLFMPSEIGFNHPLLVWKREQDEPFFTPECTLNDQYAEIEQVRQNQKTIDAMHEAEGIFGDKQLKGSQWDLQVGGDHYKSMKIQPAKFALENKLDYCQANAIKYICRHESKNGKQDLEKAKHYIDLLIEHYYGDQNAI